jgi:hypothetical protein
MDEEQIPYKLLYYYPTGRTSGHPTMDQVELDELEANRPKP